MSNGASVAFLDPPSASGPAQTAAGTAANPRPTAASEIGEAAARAAVAIAWASECYRCHGALDAAGRVAGAEALACLARLQLDSEIPDFAAVALVEGRRVLNRRHGAAFRAQLNLDAATLDLAFDTFIHPALEIAGKVTADELLLWRAWSN